MEKFDTGYLYGQLNNYVEYITPEFFSSDNTLSINSKDNNDNKIDIRVNTTNLLTLKLVIKDNDPIDDRIKYYSLYAFNSLTNNYDIKIGQEIVIDTAAGSTDDIKTAYVKVGEEHKYEQKLDDAGNPMFDDSGKPIMIPVYDEEGNPVMVPIYELVTIDVSQTGLLQLSDIPADMIRDYRLNTDGSKDYIESTLDGNVGGEVY